MTKAIENLAGADLAAFRAVLQPHVDALIPPTLVADAQAVLDDAEAVASAVAADALGAGNSEAAALAIRTAVEGFATSIAAIAAAFYGYGTYAEANEAVAGIPNGRYVHVNKDETRGGRWVIYKVVAGALAFHGYGLPASTEWWVDPLTGNNANPGTDAAPFATITHARTVMQPWDKLYIRPGARIRENFPNYTQILPDGAEMIVKGGGTATFEGFDTYTGGFTQNGASWYTTANITHEFGIGGAIGAGQHYIIFKYRKPGSTRWKQTYSRVRFEFANDAAGILWAQSTTNTCYVEKRDGSAMTAADRFNAGNDFRYHVRLPDDLDPNTCQWMVLKRKIPLFGKFHRIEGIHFHGCVERGGLTALSSHFERVTVSYPGNHACEIPGTTSNHFTVREMRQGSGIAGYGLHFYGPVAAWATQPLAEHRNLKVINWQGALIGCHADNPAANGGGGAAMVTSIIKLADGYFENIGDLGSAYNLTEGTVFEDCMFNRIGGTGGAPQADVTFRNCTFLQMSARDDSATAQDYAGGGGLFFWPKVGARLIIEGGFSNVQSSFIRHQAAAASLGEVVVRQHRTVVANQFVSFESNVPSTLTLDHVVVQKSRGPAGINTASSVLMGTGGTQTVNVTNSAFGGFIPPVNRAGWTIDEHTVWTGQTGLYANDNPAVPVMAGDESVVHSLGDRLIGKPQVIDRLLGVLTSRGFYAHGTQGNWIQTRYQTWTSAFVPRGFASFGAANNFKAWFYGLSGHVWYSPNPMTANNAVQIATGVTTNFVSHALIGTNLFLFGDAGEIVKINTADNTVTTGIASPVAWRVRGAVVVDANNALVFGGSADGVTSGGTMYTTDGGATWTAHTTLLHKQIRCGGLVNGIIVLMGANRTVKTGATVSGAFTDRPALGRGNAVSLAVDPSTKQFVFIEAGVGINNQNDRHLRRTPYFVDASNVDPSTWRTVGLPQPLGRLSAEEVIWNPNLYDGTAFIGALYYVGPTGMVLGETEQMNSASVTLTTTPGRTTGWTRHFLEEDDYSYNFAAGAA